MTCRARLLHIVRLQTRERGYIVVLHCKFLAAALWAAQSALEMIKLGLTTVESLTWSALQHSTLNV